MGNDDIPSSVDEASRHFYARVFSTALFNIYAVRNGLFGELLCESADPAIHKRWELAEPAIVQAITGRHATRRDEA